ncbi:MAG: hypothetical protein IJ307_08485 [Bacteroidales bacterium]|nr:hypothetical protein [Bacteroidales bacterium]
MDNFEISQELELMREQFRLLTEKVEKQNIISEKQLRASVRKKMSSYDWWETWAQVMILLIGGPIMVMLTHKAGMARWTVVMAIIYCILGVVLILCKKFIQDKKLNYKGDLKEFAVAIRSVRKLHIRFSIVSMPLIALFIILWSMEYFNVFFKLYDGFNPESITWCILSVILAIILAIWTDHRKLRTLDDIINEIEEL